MAQNATLSALNPSEDLEEERSPDSAPTVRLDHEAPSSYRELPRLLAVWSDVESTDYADLATVWRDLCTRRTRIYDSFFTDQRCYLLLDSAPAQRPWGACLNERQTRILECVLVGQTQKAISIDLALSAPRIAQAMSTALRAMGLSCRSSALPMLLVVAAHAARAEHKVEAKVSRLKWAGGSHAVVSTSRPDRVLADRLSESEYAVARLLVEGKSHAEIASIRGTSARTVANQLSALFHKLRISGRAELLALLARAVTRPDADGGF
jgi:DNA-binding CsgD family transcriptional regulator